MPTASSKRYLYALIGVIVMLIAGFVYAWSILSAPIAADFPGWTNAQLSLTFTICMIFFCLGGMAAGFLSKKIPVRLNVLIASALFLVGFFLVSRANSLPMLYISYGVLCGTGSGFAYNSVMNVMPRWFPQQQGLISGVLLLGFGTSSMIVGSLFTAVTPAVSGAWRTTLLVMGAVMAAVLLISAFFFIAPKAGEVPTAAKGPGSTDGLELTTAQMVRRPSFWFFFVWAMALGAVCLVIVGQAKTLAQTAAPHLDAGAISFVVGLISVCNGLGRVFLGALFDRFGRKVTMTAVVVSLFLGVVCVWLSTSGVMVLLVAGFVFIGLGFGGPPTMAASVTKQFYGEKNFAVNYSTVNLNMLASSFASTAAGAILDATGSFSLIFALLLGLVALAFVCLLCIRKP